MRSTTSSSGRIPPRRRPGHLPARTGRFAEWRRRRALFASTVHELTHLTDRDLADLGIPRADIRAIAREAAFGGTE